MNELLNTLREYWQFVALVSTGLAGVGRWWWTRKKSQRESLQMLYDQQEALRKKIIAYVEKSVQDAEDHAETKRILAEFRSHCPECYERFMQNRLTDEGNS